MLSKIGNQKCRCLFLLVFTRASDRDQMLRDEIGKATSEKRGTKKSTRLCRAGRNCSVSVVSSLQVIYKWFHT